MVSHSPLKADESELDAKRPYRASIRLVDQLIDGGNSLSGNEPKCAFLNAGDGTFATVSALSGFDFPDDGRALALTDWDRDGDLDIWMTCRTAPMLRFLRNDRTGSAQSLLLHLEGVNASRDAVGARAEVRLRGAANRPLLRTVKSGEGFLGQSSRWLHFGLGEEAVIESLRITWPGGKSDELKNIRPGHAVRFTEGDLRAESTPLTKPSAPAPPAPLTPRRAALGAAVTLFQPPVFPPLPSTTPDGKPWRVTDNDRPLLINLFASWCPDCASELTAWRDNAPAFASAGLDVALLCADGRDTAHNTNPEEAWAWLKKNRIPFSAGVLTDEAFRRLTAAHRQLFGAIVNLPLPTSFLLDGRGRLVAVYRGPVAFARILQDVKSDRASALPWPGQWLQTPDPPDPAFWINDLGAQQSWEESFAVFQRHREALRQHKDFATIAGALAEKLAAGGHYRDAIATVEAALTKTPDAPGILNNLASLLATAPDKSLRDSARALSLAQKANTLSGDKVPAILDTLAAAHAAAGDFASAVSTATRALAFARAADDHALIPVLERNLTAYRANRILE